MIHLLIVANQSTLRKQIRDYLGKRGFQIIEADDAQQAASLFQSQRFDLVLIDLAFPERSGIELCGWVRARSDVPIIVLSELSKEDLKVSALEAGADEYISKPFGNRELFASMRALLRRTFGFGFDEDEGGRVQTGALLVDLEARRVFIGKHELSLTRTEYELLAELTDHLDGVVTRDELLSRVWGPEYQGAYHYLHNYFSRLRKKLGESSDLLENVPGMGYILHSKPVER